MVSKILGDSLSTRENNFDFIRLVAAVAVIFSHSYDLTSNYFDEPLRLISNNENSIGEMAVAIFFVTSGFLITQSYQRTSGTFKYFYSRVLRIYPGLICVILFTVFILGPVLTSISFYEYFLNIKTIKYLFNLTSLKISFQLPGVFTHNPYPMDAVNGSLWSLPYELLCYIMVALIGSFIKRRYLLVFLFTMISLLFLALMTPSKVLVNGMYFLCGAIVFIYRFKFTLDLRLVAILVLILIVNLGYNPSNVLKSVIGGLCLTYIIMFLAVIKSEFLNNFSRYGDYSYGLYVWAFPIQQLIQSYYHLGHFQNFLISSVITFFAAFLSWHYIEKRFLRLKANPVFITSFSNIKSDLFTKKIEKAV
jgi:peptidoglycan/LPS O-acetylase OafA/YrhL